VADTYIGRIPQRIDEYYLFTINVHIHDKVDNYIRQYLKKAAVINIQEYA